MTWKILFDLGFPQTINQIAKRVNSTAVIYKDDINDLKKLLEKQGKDSSILELVKKVANSKSEYFIENDGTPMKIGKYEYTWKNL